MEQSGAWLLTQGVLGFTTAALSAVVWRLWTSYQACQKAIQDIQAEDAKLSRALLERVLNGLNTAGTVVSDNTKALEAQSKKMELLERLLMERKP